MLCHVNPSVICEVKSIGAKPMGAVEALYQSYSDFLWIRVRVFEVLVGRGINVVVGRLRVNEALDLRCTIDGHHLVGLAHF